MTVSVSRQTSAETSKADHHALYFRQISSRSNGKPESSAQGAMPSRQISEAASVKSSNPGKLSGTPRQVSWSASVGGSHQTINPSKQFTRQASGENVSMHSARSGHQGPLSRQVSRTEHIQRIDGTHQRELSRSLSMQETPQSASRQVSAKSAACQGATPAISRQASGARPAIARQASGATPAISRQASGTTPSISRQASAARGEPVSAATYSGSLQQLPENEPVFRNVLTGSKLRLRIIRASNLRNEDLSLVPGDVSDPFAVAKVCGQEFKTATINNNLNPQWNSDSFEFEIKSEDAELHLEVFNSNYVCKHDSLGTTKFSLNGLTPGAAQTLAKVLDEGDKKSADRESSIEVELELIPGAPVDAKVSPPVTPGVKTNLIGCKLRLWVVRASNLRNMDLSLMPGDVSDPFTVAKLCGQEFMTATINNDLNPVWNSDAFEFNVTSGDAKLHLEVFNSNFVCNHDSLGTVELDLRYLAVGAAQTLVKVLDEGNSKSADREASIEVKLELIAPAAKSNLAGNKLKLRIIRASNLRNMDLSLMPGDVSDPFAVAKLGSLECKTATINNDLNPVWNSETFEFSIPIDNAKLHLEVFNSNWVTSNDSLGTAEIDLDDLGLGSSQTVIKALDEGASKQADKEASIEVELEVIAGTSVTALASTLEVKKPRFLKTEDWVPLPNFHAPGAYDRPAWSENNGYSGGKITPVHAYFSYACRLGQYDYKDKPTYYPAQAEVCRNTWADDPFHHWRKEGSVGF